MTLAGVTLELPVREASATLRAGENDDSRDGDAGDDDATPIRARAAGASQGGTLPFTGLDLGPLVALGLLRAAVGFTLRTAVRA